VILDNLNSSAPQYVLVYNNATFANSSAAAAAITANNISTFPDGLVGLEVLNLGFLTIQADGSGGGTLTVATPAKQVFGAVFAAGAAGTSAGVITTDTSAFTEFLSATETSVQLALNKLDTRITDDVPASANATGTKGQLAYDGTHLYVCFATDTWVRVELATWA
jgi:hypothetical protein